LEILGEWEGAIKRKKDVYRRKKGAREINLWEYVVEDILTNDLCEFREKNKSQIFRKGKEYGLLKWSFCM